jgi:dihydroorotase
MGMFRRHANVYENGKFAVKEIFITESDHCGSKGGLFPLFPSNELFSFQNTDHYFYSSDKKKANSFHEVFLLPGFVDVHVHLREPGFSYKETITSGTEAAAVGGYTAVCSMPNLTPPPDSADHLKVQTDIIEKTAKVHVYPYGCITKASRGESLADLEKLADHVIAFTDDGKGVQSDDVMRAAMRKAAFLGKMIVAHCEDERYGCTPESEYLQVKRDLKLVSETGCKYHLCHASTKESVQLIREAKMAGLPVSAETAPHYLLFTQKDVLDSGDFKMNPPIRTEADRDALIEAICDGTIDMIATDHAPHSAEEKSKGFQNSLNGIVGLETAFPLIYTNFVRKGIFPMARLLALMSDNPRKIFGIPKRQDEGIIVDIGEHFTVERNKFHSLGRSMPYEGMELYGRCLATFINGRIVR